MCGIFICHEDCYQQQDFDKLQHRGPEHSILNKYNQYWVGFHRLKINDLGHSGDQPFIIDNVLLICNGEIYNHKELEKAYKFEMKSKSDCEIILRMYLKYGIEQTLVSLDGVFAFVIIDMRNEDVIVARDPIGVRPLFIGDNGKAFASEMKSTKCKKIEQFKPGHFWKNGIYGKFWNTRLPKKINDLGIDKILDGLRNRLIKAVVKRIQNAERPVGFLLSGGLDSSLVCAIASQVVEGKINTYSIGLEGSEDLKYARIVSEFIGSDHTEIRFTVGDGLNAVPEVIKCIESYDVTTVRASVPMWLLSKYIKESTRIRVLLSGEGSDEFGGYLYFNNAPSEEAFQEESFRLLDELHFTDVLRADRCTAGHGLELRVPFLDIQFMAYFLGIDVKYRMANNGIEKYFLRRAFAGWLPDKVLWRKKDAFSDAVGKEWRNSLISKGQALFQASGEEMKEWKHCPPVSGEGWWYRKEFEKHYSGQGEIIPHYWMPKWQGDVSDPSATVLKVYEERSEAKFRKEEELQSNSDDERSEGRGSQSPSQERSEAIEIDNDE